MYHLAKKLNTVSSMRTSYTYISPYTNTNNNNIEKPIYDIIERYFPHYNHLHIHPNQEFSNHYVVADLMRGTISSDLKSHHNNILDHAHEDILAMKVHSSYMNLYHLENEKQLAEHLMTNILDQMHIYNHH
jgi:hypothetical protein